MDQQSIQKYVETLEKQGFAIDDVLKYYTNSAEMAGALTYLALTTELSEEDMAAVEAMGDDVQAETEMRRLFQLRTGKSIDDYLADLHDVLLETYSDTIEEAAEEASRISN